MPHVCLVCCNFHNVNWVDYLGGNYGCLYSTQDKGLSGCVAFWHTFTWKTSNMSHVTFSVWEFWWNKSMGHMMLWILVYCTDGPCLC